jgi:hypothetical protein
VCVCSFPSDSSLTHSICLPGALTWVWQLNHISTATRSRPPVLFFVCELDYRVADRTAVCCVSQPILLHSRKSSSIRSTLFSAVTSLTSLQSAVVCRTMHLR